MKKITLIAIMILVLASNTYAAGSKMEGMVTDLFSFSQGKPEKLTVEAAKKKVENGNPIVFVSKKKVYFVYNSDGSYAGKKLAALADKAKVTISGNAQTKNGINILYADTIE